MPLQDGCDVHHRNAAGILQWNDIQFAKHGVDIWRGLRLDGAHYDILASFAPAASFVEHAEGFSDAGCVTKENFKPTAPLVAFFRLRLLQQLFRSALAWDGRRHGSASIIGYRP